MYVADGIGYVSPPSASYITVVLPGGRRSRLADDLGIDGPHKVSRVKQHSCAYKKVEGKCQKSARS